MTIIYGSGIAFLDLVVPTDLSILDTSNLLQWYLSAAEKKQQ